jgi:hypothetical protein
MIGELEPTVRGWIAPTGDRSPALKRQTPRKRAGHEQLLGASPSNPDNGSADPFRR